MRKVHQRRNELLQEKRSSVWTAEKELELHKLEARIKSSEYSQIKQSERRVEQKQQKYAVRIFKKELPHLPDLQRRQKELVYERDNNINWTYEKHYILESIHERIHRIQKLQKQFSTVGAGVKW